MQLTFDIFSGNRNPSWYLPPSIGRKILELTGDLGLLPGIPSASLPSRLGYRGLRIILPPDIVAKYHISPWITLPADTFDHTELIKEIAYIAQFFGFLGMHELQKLTELILQFLNKISPPAVAKIGSPEAGPCKFEMLTFDPKPWNDMAFKPTNNCYAYASDKRAKYPSKPQPGIGSGKEFTFVTGPDVAAAAKRDGAHDVTDCFPESEAPRMLVALVIWPGQDYHWYRKHPDCWGHKPGSTDARNVDNSNAVIQNPQTCDRGPYTEFHGYMLIPKSQKVAA